MRANYKKLFQQIFFAGLSGVLFFPSFPLPQGISLGGSAWVGLLGLFIALSFSSFSLFRIFLPGICLVSREFGKNFREIPGFLEGDFCYLLVGGFGIYSFLFSFWRIFLDPGGLEPV